MSAEESRSGRGVPWDQYGELIQPSRGPRFERYSEAEPQVTSARAPQARQASSIEAVPEREGESAPAGRRLPREGEQGRIKLRTSGGKLGYAPPAQPMRGEEIGVPAQARQSAKKRRRGIGVIVLGIVMSVLIAPATFFGIAMSGADFSAMQASAREVSSGQSVSVDSSGGYVVQVTSGQATSCLLRGSDGGEHPMQSTLNQWTVSGLQAGDYTLVCSPDGLKMVGMTGFSESVALSKAPDAMTWSSVIGMLGLSVIGLGIYLRRSR